MGRVHPLIDDKLKSFIEAQHVFFVATAPLKADGHINLSPKGLDALRIFGPWTIGYLDHVGSGAETIAHIRENGRVVIMFCAFEGAPQILRLYGEGQVIEPDHEQFGSLAARFGTRVAVRSIIRVELNRISDSCGYGVPLLHYQSERSQLAAWAERKGEDGLLTYQREHNVASIDGLPGLQWPTREGT